MPDLVLWTIDDVADFIGAASVGAARKELSRWGVRSVGRQPGRGGKSLYSPAQVRAAKDARPGRGARTDLRLTDLPPLLAASLAARTAMPDVLQDPLVSDHDSAEAVATRDLRTFHRMLVAERADLVGQLDRHSAAMLVEAVWSLITDFHWADHAHLLLAAEVADGYGDDEDGPSPDRAALADRIARSGRLHGYVLLEAALAARDLVKGGATLDAALHHAGLFNPTPTQT